MTRIKGIFLILIAQFIGQVQVSGQQPVVTYLNRPELLEKVDICLRHTYNFSFATARDYQQELLNLTPDHPVPYFLHALIIYWENFPLTQENKKSDQFLQLMDKTVNLAEPFLASEKTYLEGVFFELFGRAFKVMFWADNGQTLKIIPELGTMYRHTLEGFRLKEDFSEFYFSTGLYNYYIEAYPQAHPVYKPLIAFMKHGDKALGLIQLNKAIQETVYLRVESLFFMSLIQLHYEEELESAAYYAKKLCADYPGNIYYKGHLIIILLHQGRFREVRKVIENMDQMENPYVTLVIETAGAFMAEKETGNLGLARKKYLRVIEMAEHLGPFTDRFQAIGYMGLSRVCEKRGLTSEARKYARMASQHTTFSYILGDG